MRQGFPPQKKGAHNGPAGPSYLVDQQLQPVQAPPPSPPAPKSGPQSRIGRQGGVSDFVILYVFVTVFSACLTDECMTNALYIFMEDRLYRIAPDC